MIIIIQNIVIYFVLSPKINLNLSLINDFCDQVDRVVCAVATALRNLAIDQRNKELIGKYAMRDLIQKLPSGNNQHDQGTSDDTIAAVLATLNEVIKKNAEFSRSLLDAGGVDRLMNITRQRQKYTPRVLKFAGKTELEFKLR